jgi:hypothetical protein
MPSKASSRMKSRLYVLGSMPLFKNNSSLSSRCVAFINVFVPSIASWNAFSTIVTIAL